MVIYGANRDRLDHERILKWSRHMRARVVLKETMIEVPTARFASDTLSVDVHHVETLQDLSRAIVNFDAQSIDEDWLKENRPGPPHTMDF